MDTNKGKSDEDKKNSSDNTDPSSGKKDDKSEEVWKKLLSDPDVGPVLRAYGDHRARGPGKTVKELEAELTKLQAEREERDKQEEEARLKKLEEDGKKDELIAELRGKAESGGTASQKLEQFEKRLTELLEKRAKKLPEDLQSMFAKTATMSLLDRQDLLSDMEARALDASKNTRSVHGGGGRNNADDLKGDEYEDHLYSDLNDVFTGKAAQE